LSSQKNEVCKERNPHLSGKFDASLAEKYRCRIEGAFRVPRPSGDRDELAAGWQQLQSDEVYSIKEQRTRAASAVPAHTLVAPRERPDRGRPGEVDEISAPHDAGKAKH
jgi:hypothetical protein